GVLVGAQGLLGAGGNLEPGNRHVARPELPRVHQRVVAKPVPLLGGSFLQAADEHRRACTRKNGLKHQYQGGPPPRATKVTSLPGTTTSLTTSLPSRWSRTFSLSRASASRSASDASAAASIRSRSLPLTWTTRVTVSLTSRLGSAVGHELSQRRPPSNR